VQLRTRNWRAKAPPTSVQKDPNEVNVLSVERTIINVDDGLDAGDLSALLISILFRDIQSKGCLIPNARVRHEWITRHVLFLPVDDLIALIILLLISLPVVRNSGVGLIGYR
jgi:hypothetical protein